MWTALLPTSHSNGSEIPIKLDTTAKNHWLQRAGFSFVIGKFTELYFLRIGQDSYSV